MRANSLFSHNKTHWIPLDSRRLAIIASKALHECLLQQLLAAEQLLAQQATTKQQRLQEAEQRKQQEQQEQVKGHHQGGGASVGLKLKGRHRRFMSFLGHELSRMNPHAALGRRWERKAGRESAGAAESDILSGEERSVSRKRGGVDAAGRHAVGHRGEGAVGGPLHTVPEGGRSLSSTERRPRNLKRLHALAQAQTPQAPHKQSARLQQSSHSWQYQRFQQQQQQSQSSGQHTFHSVHHGKAHSHTHHRQRSHSFGAFGSASISLTELLTDAGIGAAAMQQVQEPPFHSPHGSPMLFDWPRPSSPLQTPFKSLLAGPQRPAHSDSPQPQAATGADAAGQQQQQQVEAQEQAVHHAVQDREASSSIAAADPLVNASVHSSREGKEISKGRKGSSLFGKGSLLRRIAKSMQGSKKGRGSSSHRQSHSQPHSR